MEIVVSNKCPECSIVQKRWNTFYCNVHSVSSVRICCWSESSYKIPMIENVLTNDKIMDVIFRKILASCRLCRKLLNVKVIRC